jgi:hypothetical protein
MTAAEAIKAAKQLVDTFGWPAYSPWQALHAIEKKMVKGDPQISLMWDACIKEGVRHRRGETGLHPVHHIHVQDGQTKEGIDEWFADAIDRAEHHPLNGATDAPPTP